MKTPIFKTLLAGLLPDGFCFMASDMKKS